MNINSIMSYSFKGNIEVRVKPKGGAKSTVCTWHNIDPNSVKSIDYNPDFNNSVITLKDNSKLVTEERGGVDFHRALVSAYGAAKQPNSCKIKVV